MFTEAMLVGGEASRRLGLPGLRVVRACHVLSIFSRGQPFDTGGIAEIRRWRNPPERCARRCRPITRRACAPSRRDALLRAPHPRAARERSPPRKYIQCPSGTVPSLPTTECLSRHTCSEKCMTRSKPKRLAAKCHLSANATPSPPPNYLAACQGYSRRRQGPFQGPGTIFAFHPGCP
jgi:hypothetical protein